MLKQLVFSGLIIVGVVLLVQQSTGNVNEFLDGRFNLYWVVLMILGTLWATVRGFLTFKNGKFAGNDNDDGFPRFDREFLRLILSQAMIFGIANFLLFIVALIQFYLNNVQLSGNDYLSLGLYFLEALLIFILYFLLGSIFGSYTAKRRES